MEDNTSRAQRYRGKKGSAGHAALHTMLGAWTLSSKQWGVTEKQGDGNCTVERLLWRLNGCKEHDFGRRRSESAVGVSEIVDKDRADS